MEICVQRIQVDGQTDDLLIFYATDVDGHIVPSGAGRDGLDKILGILTARLRDSLARRHAAQKSQMHGSAPTAGEGVIVQSNFRANYEVIEQSLVAGQAIVERFVERGSPQFQLWGEGGEILLLDWTEELDNVLAAASTWRP